MAEIALIVSCDHWQFPDEKTGEIREGNSVWFLNSYREDSSESIGFKPTKINASDEVARQLFAARLPGIFEMHYGSRPGAKNAATLTLVGVKFVREVSLFGAPGAPAVSAVSKVA